MLGTGLTFSAGVGAIASLVGGIAWLLPGGPTLTELLIPVVGAIAWSFPVGVVFSGFLALTARGRSFEELSLPRMAVLGAGGGLVLYGLLAANAWSAWTVEAAISNAVILVGLGAGTASSLLVVARRAEHSLEAGDESPALAAGDVDGV